MRIDAITSTPLFRRTLVAASILLVVLTLHMYRNVSALFTDEDDTALGIYQTATLLIDVEQEVGVDLDVDNLIPGDTIERNLIVLNAGTVPFTYSVYLRAPDTPPPSLLWSGADGLVFRIVDDGSGSPVGTPQPVSALDADHAIPLGVLVPGQSETIRFRLELPVTADNTYQNLEQTISFVFRAVQLASTAR